MNSSPDQQFQRRPHQTLSLFAQRVSAPDEGRHHTELSQLLIFYNIEYSC